MKRLTSILIMALTMLLTSNILRASNTDPLKTSNTEVDSTLLINDKEPEPDVYWYFIRMRMDSKKRDIEITSGGSKITMGSRKAFSKAVWWGIAHRQVAIGPFYSEAEALNSRIYYKKSKEKITELPQPTAPSSLHWFQVSFKELKRLNSYEFTNSPAAVASGSSSQFTDALFEGLSFQLLSIGPFWDYTHAEEAKAIYRLNE